MARQILVQCQKCKRKFLRYVKGTGRKRDKKPHAHSGRAGLPCNEKLPCIFCGGQVK